MWCKNPPTIHLIHRTQQLRLQYEFAFLVLLRRLVRLVVLPPHRLLALPAHYIPHNVPTRRHVAFAGVRLRNVHDGVEEVGFAVLAAEVLHYFQTISTSPSPLPGWHVELGDSIYVCSVAWHRVCRMNRVVVVAETQTVDIYMFFGGEEADVRGRL